MVYLNVRIYDRGESGAGASLGTRYMTLSQCSAGGGGEVSAGLATDQSEGSASVTNELRIFFFQDDRSRVTSVTMRNYAMKGL